MNSPLILILRALFFVLFDSFLLFGSCAAPRVLPDTRGPWNRKKNIKKKKEEEKDGAISQVQPNECDPKEHFKKKGILTTTTEREFQNALWTRSRTLF